MTAQLDMFSPAGETVPAATDSDFIGLAITLLDPCPRCRGHDAMIGAGRAPHNASIMSVCGRHLGWMSIATFNFLNATVQQLGRPTEPICVSRSRTTAEEKSSTTANAIKENCNG
jgi:hypothetical protein